MDCGTNRGLDLWILIIYILGKFSLLACVKNYLRFQPYKVPFGVVRIIPRVLPFLDLALLPS